MQPQNTFYRRFDLSHLVAKRIKDFSYYFSFAYTVIKMFSKQDESSCIGICWHDFSRNYLLFGNFGFPFD